MASWNVDVLTESRDELFSPRYDLKTGLHDAEEDVIFAQFENTALAKRIKTFELKRKCIRAEKKSFPKMEVKPSTTRLDQKRKKRDKFCQGSTSCM